MKILAIGDVTGPVGCEHLRRVLPSLKAKTGAELVIVNGENSAARNGISRSSAEHLFTSGADVITTGNHAFRCRDIYPEFERNEFLLRPANYPAAAPGRGITIVDRGYVRACVINLIGVVYMMPLACPFETADKLLETVRDIPIKIIDFHAEATAEKKALAYYLAGRVSAVFGTHTHTPTADETILRGKTGFITDIGMTGPVESVLGITPELSVAKIKDKLPVQFEYAQGECAAQGVLMQVDNKTGVCTHIERITA